MSDNLPFSTNKQELASASASPVLSEQQPVGAAEETHVFPVIEERATVQREVVETGRVRLTRQVHETDETVSVPVQHDEVDVERVAFNQVLAAGAPVPTTRHEGDTMIIPVLREVAVVEKRLLLVEELRVTKRQVTTEHTESLHLRREEISVERVPTTPPLPTEPGSVSPS